MSIRKVTPDKKQAKSLLANAESFILSVEPIKDTAKATFLINTEYTILHSLCAAILAYDGEKIKGKDHHKILINRIGEKYSFTNGQISLFDEVRKIRNDINYYGQKEESTIEDFYQRNKERMGKIREVLLKVMKEKLE